jgi:hypothetical protein
VSPFAQLVTALQAAWASLMAWLASLFRPATPVTPAPAPAAVPAATPLPMGSLAGPDAVAGPSQVHQGSVAVGSTQVNAAITANASGATAGATLSSPKVVGAVVATASNGQVGAGAQVAIKAGEQGVVTAAGLVQSGPTGLQAGANLGYQAPTLAAEAHYVQNGDMHAAGATVDKRFDHSALGLGAEYLWRGNQDGGRVYGRWQSDAVGETVAGYQVRGSIEGGALKQPGESWAPYAAGRVTAEKENSALFLEARQSMPMGGRSPETQVMAGLQFRF